MRSDVGKAGRHDLAGVRLVLQPAQQAMFETTALATGKGVELAFGQGFLRQACRQVKLQLGEEQLGAGSFMSGQGGDFAVDRQQQQRLVGHAGHKPFQKAASGFDAPDQNGDFFLGYYALREGRQGLLDFFAEPRDARQIDQDQRPAGLVQIGLCIAAARCLRRQRRSLARLRRAKRFPQSRF